MSEIFISYAREDRALAERLCRFLTESGYTVWWDHELSGGAHVRATILEQLRAARCAIVIWTPNSVGSNWVHDEADEASRARRLIPVVDHSLDYDLIPLGFRSVQTLRFDDQAALLKSLQRMGVQAGAATGETVGSTLSRLARTISTRKRKRNCWLGIAAVLTAIAITIDVRFFDGNYSIAIVVMGVAITFTVTRVKIQLG